MLNLSTVRFTSRFSLISIISLLLLFLASCTVAPQSLVFSQRGTIPIILTTPHGGYDWILGVPERTRGNRLQDSRTQELTEELMERLERLTGSKPYVAMARFHRKYIDANRSEGRALENPNAVPYYLAYHDTVRNFVDEVREQYPRGALLIDIHGFRNRGDIPNNTVCRGTRDGQTVKGLLERNGIDAFIGPKSILGNLQASGYEVFPPNTPPGSPSERHCYRGGFTVITYGSNNADGIDAIQIEIGWDLREDDVRPQFVRAFAKAIVEFYKEYLAAK